MPSFQFSVPHTLGAEKAEAKIRNFLEMAKRGYGQGVSLKKEEWNGSTVDFVLKISGFHLTGNIAIADEAVAVSGSLPLTAFFFSGKIKKNLREQLSKVLRNRKKPATEPKS
jgi:hypothetical protein